MGESLTQPRRVSDEGLRVVKLFSEARKAGVGNDPGLTVPQE